MDDTTYIIEKELQFIKHCLGQEVMSQEYNKKYHY